MAKNISIAVFTPFYPPVIGGLSNHAVGFNQALRSHGYSFYVFTPQLNQEKASTPMEAAEATIYFFPAVELIPNFPIPAFWRPSFWSWWKKIEDLEVELIISRTRFFATSLMAWWYARRQRKPHLHVEHGADFVQTGSKMVRFLARLYDFTAGRFILQQADKIATVSQSSAEFVQRLSGRSDSVVIYRGLDFTPAPRSPQQTNIVSLLYLGRLIEGKGLHHLIEALSQVFTNKSLPAWHCTIIGSGPMQRQLERQLAQLPPHLPLTLKPEVSPAEVPFEFSQADIFINPSLTEGLPTSVIEALRSECRVVATRVGGTEEIVTSPALVLFPPGNIAELKQALTQVLASNYAWKFPSHLPGELAEKFSWTKAARKYDQLLTSLLHNHAKT